TTSYSPPSLYVRVVRSDWRSFAVEIHRVDTAREDAGPPSSSQSGSGIQGYTISLAGAATPTGGSPLRAPCSRPPLRAPCYKWLCPRAAAAPESWPQSAIPQATLLPLGTAPAGSYRPLRAPLATAWPWVAGPAWGLAVAGCPSSSLPSLRKCSKNA
ncbi:hypothetical protein B296_00045169, partial [Ensete ventricosum]